MSTRAPHPMDDELQRFLAAIVDSMDEIVVVTDARLEPLGPQIVFVNQRFTEVTGYAADQVIVQSLSILHGPEADRAVLDHLRHDREMDRNSRFEIVSYRKDGSTYLSECRISPLRNAAGEITHWLSLQRYITA